MNFHSTHDAWVCTDFSQFFIFLMSFSKWQMYPTSYGQKRLVSVVPLKPKQTLNGGYNEEVLVTAIACFSDTCFSLIKQRSSIKRIFLPNFKVIFSYFQVWLVFPKAIRGWNAEMQGK